MSELKYITKEEAKKIAGIYKQTIDVYQQTGPGLDDWEGLDTMTKQEVLQAIEQSTEIELYDHDPQISPYDFILKVGKAYITINTDLAGRRQI